LASRSGTLVGTLPLRETATPATASAKSSKRARSTVALASSFTVSPGQRQAGFDARARMLADLDALAGIGRIAGDQVVLADVIEGQGPLAACSRTPA
jgi:hypothetical protein